jgi:hypothetical protein
MKPIEEIYRGFPDEEREKAVSSAPAGRAPDPRTFALALRLVLFVVALFLVGGVTSGIYRRECAEEHERRAVRLEIRSYLQLREVARAIEERRRLSGTLPSGLGEAGAGLSTALGKPLRYRAPGLHNPDGFDLWTEDRHGDPIGLRNWHE